MLLASDRARRGAHARPLTGVALAVNVGLLTGANELMLRGAASLTDDLGALLTAPYLYVFAVAAPLAMGQLQIALQRSRLAVAGLVATATAKTYLFLVATPLYGEPWPSERGRAAAALALTILAVAAVPHHEPRTEPRDRERGTTIYVLPGTYREEPSDKPRPDGCDWFDTPPKPAP